MPEIIEMKLGRDGTYQENKRIRIPDTGSMPITKVHAKPETQVDILGEIHKAAEGYLINFVRSFL